jgi:glycerol-3-phosphate dehydrogenase
LEIKNSNSGLAVSSLKLRTGDPNCGLISALDRAKMIARLSAETFDVVIIGGGINGAAIARDAAMRNLRVALVDKGDFAGATSSRSSKLIHGGLRYLPQGQLKMVYDALRERERLRRVTAPHLVRSIQFLMPFFRGRRPGRLAILAGLTLYDVMALTPHTERHHRLSVSGVQEIEPSLRLDNLTGGVTYYDGSGDDARITLENVLDAAYHGAAVVNYAVAEDFERSGSSLNAVAVRDLETGVLAAVRVRRVVNAAGPWVDDLRRVDDPACTAGIRLTKGVHLVIEFDRLPVRNALVLTDHGGRIIFVIPHGRYVLVGTTDTDFNGDRETVAADKDDVEYLLAVVCDALPEFALTATDVVASFAGLRALPRIATDARPSSVPREEVILESPSGLITVAGGKLTTHRRIAEHVVDLICARLGLPTGKSPTLNVPLPGACSVIEDDPVSITLPLETCRFLNKRYGTRAPMVAAVAAENTDLIKPLNDGASTIGAEVIFAARYEMARSVGDFLVRRTSMTWQAPLEAFASAPIVARLMARELRWGPEREISEVNRFRKLSEIDSRR